MRSGEAIMENEMSEHEQQSSEQPTQAQQRNCKLRRRRRFGVAALLLVGLGAVLGAVAVGTIGASAYGGFGHHAAHHGEYRIESAERHIQRKASWMLRAMDASPEQAQQVETVLSSTLSELYPVIELHRANRALWLEELSKPEVDFAALETLRGQELMFVESLSVSLLDALGGVAEVLTPEQRRELIEGMMHHRH